MALRSWLRRSLALVCAVVALAAAAPAASAATARGARAAQTFDPNGVLKVGAPIALNSGVTTLDPRLSNAAGDVYYMQPLYAPLMIYKPSTAQYTPYLAQSVTVVNPQTVKVVIRSDAKFDNGQPVTAADAKATLEAMAANSKSGKAAALNPGIQLISRVDVVDNATFNINLSQAGLGVIYELLIGRESFIVPASVGASQSTQPLGSGPFKFGSTTPGQQISVVKSTTFFDAKTVRLQGVQFVNMTEGSNQATALLAGDIDINSAFGGGLDTPSFVNISSNSKFSTANVQTGTNFLYLDTCRSTGSFFSDPNVRLALQYGTDRKQLNTAVYQGLGIAATQMWTPGNKNFNSVLAKSYPYNPKKAQALLTKAGVQAGTTVNFLVSNQVQQFTPAALVLKDNWSKLGINLNLTPSSDITTDFYRPAAAAVPPTPPKIPVTVALYARPDSAKLSFLFTPGALRNVCNFNDPKIVQAIADIAALSPTDPQAVAKWKDISSYIASINALMPLAFAPSLFAWSKNVGGVTPDTLGRGSVVAFQYQSLYKKSKG